MEMNRKAFYEQETRANHPPAINPFETILLNQIYWERKSVTVNFWQKRIADENMRM